MGSAIDPEAHPAITAGRRNEIGRLTEVLGRLKTGRPQVVEIQGEPGIGKTRLLEELARMAADRGMESVSGRAGEYERDVPFGIVAEALDRLAGAGGDAETRAVVAALSPDPAAGAATGADRYRLYRTVRRMAVRFARPPGLVVLLDDLHWADGASLELLEHVLLDMPRIPLLVALAYRGHRVPPGLPAALAGTRADVTRLAPGPLGAADVAELLPGVSARRRRLLLAASGGNPLHLEALARVDERTVAAPDRTGQDAMPCRLRALLRTELRSLDPMRRLVAQAAAIAGDSAEPDLVTSIADAPEDEVSRALDDLVALGVVRTAGSRVRFRHPLVRAAAYRSAGPAWRIGGHRRAEEYLRARGGPLPLRAHHLSRSAPAGDDDVISTLVEAATAALDTAPAHAAEWTRTALRLLPDRAERRVEVLLLLARALGLTGRLAESRDVLHEVLATPGPRRAVAVRLRAVVDRLLGRLDEARALLEAESPDDPFERCRIVVELAATAVLRGDLAGCAAHARTAVGLGLELGDRGQVAAGTTLLGLAALHGAEITTARGHATDALRLVDGLSDAEMRDHLHVLPPLAWLELHLERYADSARHLNRGLAVARANGHTHVLPYLLIVDSALHARTGRLGQSRQRAEDARETSALIGSPETAAMADAVELRSALWQRGPEAAAELAGVRAKSLWWAQETDVFVATVHLFADRPGDAAEHIAPHVGDDPKDVVGLHAVRWCGSLAVAKARLGAPEEALDLAEHAQVLADAADLPFQRGSAHLTRSRVLAECGRHAAAVDAADAAVRRFTEARAPLYRAMAHEAAAVSLSAAGDPQRAHTEFGLARNGYAACDAGWLLTRVRDSESRLGALPPLSGRPDAVRTVDALSAREWEVARLVADGLTNREIAARLFLSAKTVETHLARMFTKLGVKSRVGVARRLSGSA
ncbi:AAA family ATPase [Umezawaea sp. Da 62-37]|uniref:ATP-binding protein n=1 Tax=Umezawaea sp. Da 62-37 TaxID=3075927 RepID=UPI0028F718FC|nr:AAA family ATPase [Umezawaea sp. Da 62-37]WNV88641.1 AAA family ATPase [Umezawaea sp. Da 62-37]